MTSRVVMVASDGDGTRALYHHLARTVGVERVVLETPVSSRELLLRRVKRLGLPTVMGQVLFKGLVDAPLRACSSARIQAIKDEFGLDDRPLPEDACIHVSSINSTEAVDALKRLAPAVVVVSGTRILASHVLSAVSAPFINMHAGITPLYRGVHGGYWALANRDEENCGVTVHLVSSGIDTGDIVAQARVTPGPHDNFATYPYLQLAAGLPLLTDAVRRALEGSLATCPAPVGTSRLWSHPTLGEYVRARLARGVR